MEYDRAESKAIPPKERIKDFREFHIPLPLSAQQEQGARCMECGVPFCQYGGNIRGMTSGCPLHNLIPEWNDLVYRGNFEQAYERLKKTSNFPEFTSRVCPALCEKACTCGLNDEPVSVKENERAIIEYAYEHGLCEPKPPGTRTGRKIAVVGSGPAGLAAADELNHRGHEVTVYERSDRVGGLLRYGIPNMKLEKTIIDRKLKVMEAEGVTFVTGVNVGKDIKAEKLLKEYDAVILSCGSSNPRDIEAAGRDAKGIYFAVDYLTAATKSLYDKAAKPTANDMNASGKDVLVIGGGDTGNDCVGTAIRQGAKSVLQLEMMPKPPISRRENNPWPEWPLVLKTDYGQEEAIAVFGDDPQVYQTTVTEFKKDAKGRLTGAALIKLESVWDDAAKRNVMRPVTGSESEVKCDLVLIAAGFLGSEEYIRKAFGVEADARTNIAAGISGRTPHGTNIAKVYTAGDARTGQSLVVKAIADGRACAHEIDERLL